MKKKEREREREREDKLKRVESTFVARHLSEKSARKKCERKERDRIKEKINRLQRKKRN
jgi:hypothetical protein